MRLHPNLRTLFSSTFRFLLVCSAFAPAIVAAAPVLVTPQLMTGIQGASYSSSLLIASSAALNQVTISGVPAGISAVHNGTGTILFTGTPTSGGTYPVQLHATDINGDTLDTTVSLRVDRIAEPATAIAASYLHSCAAVAGGAQCWGFNDKGQLGDGTTGSSYLPVQTIAPGNGVTAVATSVFHSCAVVNAGVQCWGDNGTGQLGNQRMAASLVPVEALAAGSNVTAVATGTLFTCALVFDGVKCWGLWATFRSATPVDVLPPGSHVVAISAGYSHVCALALGGVTCWGLNDQGQLGNGSREGSTVPVTAIAPGSGVTAIGMGGPAQSCAVVQGGITCWGAVFSPFNTSRDVPFAIIPAGSGATHVVAGMWHTCAIVTAVVKCWGEGGQGQLGNRQSVNFSQPVTAVEAGNDIESLAAGYFHTCGLANGKIRCWGSDFYNTFFVDRPSATPVPTLSLPTDAGVTAISAGARTCAVIGGGVSCWGGNGSGALGNGSLADSIEPVQALPPGSGVTVVSIGLGFACAIANGGVLCWGTNSAFELGNGSTAALSTTPVQTLPPGSQVVALATGNKHACVVIAGGVSCWGANYDGMLGNPAFLGGSRSPVEAIPAGSGATAVVAGYSHTCAVVAGGVKCWGNNESGMLGNGTRTSSPVPVQTIPAGSGVTAIATGVSSMHTCAIVNGGVICWGSNGYGQINDSSAFDHLTPVVVIPAGSGVTSLSLGAVHSCAAVAGAVKCWGENSFGQVGDGTQSGRSSMKTIIGAGAGVIDVAAGSLYTCARVGGGVACWGSNTGGQLANLSSSPVWHAETVRFSADTTLKLRAISSRKIHDGIGALDIAIDATQPVSGAVTTESRAGPHTLVFRFNGNVSAAGTASVTPSGTAQASVAGNEVLVSLTGIADGTRASVGLTGVDGTVSIPAVTTGYLLGDVDGNGVRDHLDINALRARLGRTTDAALTRFDLNLSGRLSAADLVAAKVRPVQVLSP